MNTEKSMTLKEIADKLGAKVQGDQNYKITGLRDLERLQIPASQHKLYFIESKKMLKKHPEVVNCPAVLTTEELASNFKNAIICEAKESRLKFIETLKLFEFQYSPTEKKSDRAYIHSAADVHSSAIVYPGAVILEGAKIGANSVIFPCAVIEPFAEIGENTVIHPNVVIGYKCIIGNHCRIFGGTVIGADGFGFYDHGDDNRHKIPQIGNVVISDNVEIGSGCTIDRATIESTFIGEHTKLDDQVHIGHNCQIGRYIYIAGSAVLAGSVKIEDYAIIAGQATIAQGITIHSKAVLLGMSATQRDIEAGAIYFGAVQAMPVKQMHRSTSHFMNLPEIVERLEKLEQKLLSTDE